MIPWKRMADFPNNFDEEVVLTNGKDITRAKFDKKKKSWSYATALMWNATHWCRKKDFEEIFPKREEGK